MKFRLLFFTFILCLNVKAQNLLEERIWKVTATKRSIFLDKGVFHSDDFNVKANLTNVRNSFVKSRGYERLVFDFDSNLPPRLYGHISQKGNKLYLDFNNTNITGSIDKLKNVKYVDNVNFFTIDEGTLTAEVNFSTKVSFDVFYLENPGRIVVDIKK
jgi:hypothetical protein